jgi:hypothetical protein
VKFHFLPVLLFLFAPLILAAQVPFYTQIDSAEMHKMHANKIHYVLALEQPFDSVTGKLKTKSPFDSIITCFDREGRRIEFRFTNEDGSKAHTRLYYDSRGRAVRRFSYDNDSTNGFLDYWTYNEKNQVIKEISCTREGDKEEPYNAEKFFYDNSGHLVKKESFSIADNDAGELINSELYYYLPNNVEMQVEIDADGDTISIDTIGNLHAPGPYFARNYYYAHSRNGKRTKYLVRDSRTTVDSLGARTRQIYTSKSFSYSDGKPDGFETDTTFSDRNDNILEVYTDQYIEKYFYDDKGEFEYMIRYNRRHQPLYKRTAVVVHYE